MMVIPHPKWALSVWLYINFSLLRPSLTNTLVCVCTFVLNVVRLAFNLLNSGSLVEGFFMHSFMLFYC